MAARRATGLALVLLAGLLPGASAPAQDAHTSIVGGSPAEAGEYPWQAAVLKEEGGSLFVICGGTLIDAQRVVTAAHCTSGDAADTKVLIGTQLLSSGGEILDVSSYADHPSYSSATSRFDAAVLELASSGVAAGGEPLELIGEEGSAADALWAAGDELAISGWGSTSEEGGFPDELQEARVPRVADTTCGQSTYYGNAFHAPSMLCAGPAAGGVDTCQGDSGGPLVAPAESPPPVSENDPSKWRLVGITSWGDGCARPQKPGVYTRVAAPEIRDFILGTGMLFTLAVEVAGSGTVTSDVGSIDCPPDCSFGYDAGEVVTLTASAAGGSAFLGWEGACSGMGACTVTMDEARTVIARFTPTTHTLSIVKQGGGSGVVSSTPAGIDCGDDCAQTYVTGTVVELTAVAAPGSTFAGWDGASCSGIGTCTVTMSETHAVTATFGVQAEMPAPPPDDSQPVTADETPPVAAIASERLRMRRRGLVRVRIDCSESPEDCLGALRVRLRRDTVGRASFEIVAGDAKRVRVRLKRRARRLVRREGRVRVRLVAAVRDAAGNGRTLREKLALRAG